MELSGGGEAKGTIVANSFEAFGGTSVTFSEEFRVPIESERNDTNTDLEVGQSSEGTPKNLIIDGNIIEN